MKPLEQFDYRVNCEDFLLYELGRLIDEDKASLDEPEFRNLIDAGIAEHVERRLDIRAEMARALRLHAVTSTRALRAIEDIESPLRDFPEIIESYTQYLFERLDVCASTEPDERITAAADALLDSPDDRTIATVALDVLTADKSAISARVLAHAISEPMLPEDLEAQVYDRLRAMWPLPRHYILYSLKPHTHEDIPFRWFQLLIDCEEPSAVDRILEEVVVHGDDPTYREDLLALTGLFQRTKDPETDDKVLQVLNSEDTPRRAAEILETFLKDAKSQKRDQKETGPWPALNRTYASNRKYLAAARLFDAGKKDDAARALDELLKEEPQYPIALMLRRLI
jgi:hypothetical protein